MTTENTTPPLTHWEKYGAKYKKCAILVGLALLGAVAKAYAGGAFRGRKESGGSEGGSDLWQTADGSWFNNPSDAAEYHQDVYGKGWD